MKAIPGVQTVGYAGGGAGGGGHPLADERGGARHQLAEEGGFDVLRALQSRAPQVAVYVLTTSPVGCRKAAERLGARGFFDKSHDIHSCAKRSP